MRSEKEWYTQLTLHIFKRYKQTYHSPSPTGEGAGGRGLLNGGWGGEAFAPSPNTRTPAGDPNSHRATRHRQ